MGTLFKAVIATAPTLEWASGPTVLLPIFDISGVVFAVGQVWTMERSLNNFATFDSATFTVTELPPAMAFNFGGPWATGDWKVRVKYDASAYSNTVTVALVLVDVTAPILSNPIDIKTGTLTGSGSVTTNENNGTLYWVVVLTASGTPTKAQVKLGQTASGAAAIDTGTQPITSTGVHNVAGGFTGLAADTAYTAHYMHEDNSGNQSNVSSGDGFTTDVQATITLIGKTGPLNRAFSGAAFTFNLTDTINNGDDIMVALSWDQSQGGGNIHVVTIAGVTIPPVAATAADSTNNYHGCTHRLENWTGGTVATALVNVDPIGTPGRIHVGVLRLNNCASGHVDFGRTITTTGGLMRISDLEIPVQGVGFCWGYTSIGTTIQNRTALPDCVMLWDDIFGTTQLADACTRIVPGNPGVIGFNNSTNSPTIWVGAISFAIG